MTDSRSTGSQPNSQSSQERAEALNALQLQRIQSARSELERLLPSFVDLDELASRAELELSFSHALRLWLADEFATWSEEARSRAQSWGITPPANDDEHLSALRQGWQVHVTPLDTPLSGQASELSATEQLAYRLAWKHWDKVLSRLQSARELDKLKTLRELAERPTTALLDWADNSRLKSLFHSKSASGVSDAERLLAALDELDPGLRAYFPELVAEAGQVPTQEATESVNTFSEHERLLLLRANFKEESGMRAMRRARALAAPTTAPTTAPRSAAATLLLDYVGRDMLELEPAILHLALRSINKPIDMNFNFRHEISGAEPNAAQAARAAQWVSVLPRSSASDAPCVELVLTGEIKEYHDPIIAREYGQRLNCRGEVLNIGGKLQRVVSWVSGTKSNAQLNWIVGGRSGRAELTITSRGVRPYLKGNAAAIWNALLARPDQAPTWVPHPEGLTRYAELTFSELRRHLRGIASGRDAAAQLILNRRPAWALGGSDLASGTQLAAHAAQPVKMYRSPYRQRDYALSKATDTWLLEWGMTQLAGRLSETQRALSLIRLSAPGRLGLISSGEAGVAGALKFSGLEQGLGEDQEAARAAWAELSAPYLRDWQERDAEQASLLLAAQKMSVETLQALWRGRFFTSSPAADSIRFNKWVPGPDDGHPLSPLALNDAAMTVLRMMPWGGESRAVATLRNLDMAAAALRPRQARSIWTLTGRNIQELVSPAGTPVLTSEMADELAQHLGMTRWARTDHPAADQPLTGQPDPIHESFQACWRDEAGRVLQANDLSVTHYTQVQGYGTRTLKSGRVKAGALGLRLRHRKASLIQHYIHPWCSTHMSNDSLNLWIDGAGRLLMNTRSSSRPDVVNPEKALRLVQSFMSTPAAHRRTRREIHPDHRAALYRQAQDLGLDPALYGLSGHPNCPEAQTTLDIIALVKAWLQATQAQRESLQAAAALRPRKPRRAEQENDGEQGGQGEQNLDWDDVF